MPSRYAQLLTELEDKFNESLATQLGLDTPFRDTPDTGKKHGVAVLKSWQNQGDRYETQVQLNMDVYLVGAYSSFKDARVGGNALLVGLDNALPVILKAVQAASNGFIIDASIGSINRNLPPASSRAPSGETVNSWMAEAVATVVLIATVQRGLDGSHL